MMLEGFEQVFDDIRTALSSDTGGTWSINTRDHNFSTRDIPANVIEVPFSDGIVIVTVNWKEGA
jgi:hypothetical protein